MTFKYETLLPSFVTEARKRSLTSDSDLAKLCDEMFPKLNWGARDSLLFYASLELLKQ